MDFKEAYTKIEMELAKKVTATCADPENINQHAFEVYSGAMASIDLSVPDMSLPQKAVFLGKALALNGVDYLKPGFTPTEIQTALTEVAQTFAASFVDMGFRMYKGREDQLALEKQANPKVSQNQAQAQAQASQEQTDEEGRVVDLSKLKSRIR